MIQENSMAAFCTGSRVYGTPNESSDIDLVVVFSSQQDINRLIEMGDQNEEESHYGVIRFGRLNIIAMLDGQAKEYSAWNRATKELVAIRPVSRSAAIKLIKSYLVRR